MAARRRHPSPVLPVPPQHERRRQQKQQLARVVFAAGAATVLGLLATAASYGAVYTAQATAAHFSIEDFFSVGLSSFRTPSLTCGNGTILRLGVCVQGAPAIGAPHFVFCAM